MSEISVLAFLTEIEVPKVSELGGKGYSLVILSRNGFDVPRGFIVPSKAFTAFLRRNELRKRIEQLTSVITEDDANSRSTELRNLILGGSYPREVAHSIIESTAKLSVQCVAIRSSAVSEDSSKASFAGLHDTYLDIRSSPEQVLEGVKKCWSSLFNERAIVYRLKRGFPCFEGMAVIIQEMISAEVSGVTFTAHPDTGDDSIVIIEDSAGLGEKVVSGKISPERFVVRKADLVITDRLEGKAAEKPVIEDYLAKNVAKVCLTVEKLFGYPQDIEWCVASGRIYLLQSRCITSLEREGK